MRSILRPWKSLLLGVSLVLAACTEPVPLLPQGPQDEPTPTPSPSPSPSPSSDPQATPDPSGEVQGRLHDLATGKPLAGATVLVGTQTRSSASDGSFLAAVTGTNAGLATTILAEGYVPLTVYGYAGGPLFMRPSASSPLATSSVTVALQAPAGASSESALAIAVKPPGYRHASTAYLGTASFSAQGTASVTVTLPVGEATLLAYGTKGTVVGSLQAPVSASLSLTLSEIPSYQLYQASVPKLREDAATTQLAAFSLVWPGETPEASSSLGLGLVSGETTNRPIALPPASAFGLSQASYAVTGSVLTSSTPRVTLAERTLSTLTPGAFGIPLLSEPQGQLLAGSFGLLPGAITGATAYYADVLDSSTQAPLWRVVSLGQAPSRLTLPELPASLQSWRLTTGKAYRLQVGAADGMLGFKATRAYSQGQPQTVTLPSGDQP